jgi:hypothetical protein
MNPTPSVPAAPRRRIWPWVVGICLAPFVLLAVAVASFLTLDSDAAVLRRHVMSATHADWHTKVQCSVGGITLGALRSGLLFVRKPEVADARLALASIKRASVGVYELRSHSGEWSREGLFGETDRAMQARGWSRLVGVCEGEGKSVLVYASTDTDEDEPIDLCIAVVDGRELVVVSTSVDPATLGELVQKHTPDDFKKLASHHRRVL